jgi:hypothetical protein
MSESLSSSPRDLEPKRIIFSTEVSLLSILTASSIAQRSLFTRDIFSIDFISAKMNFIAEQLLAHLCITIRRIPPPVSDLPANAIPNLLYIFLLSWCRTIISNSVQNQARQEGGMMDKNACACMRMPINIHQCKDYKRFTVQG